MLFPSALVFYGGLGGFLRRLNSGRGTFVEVVAGQAVIRERLLARNRLLRRLVFAGFSLAVRIQRAGSVKRSLGNFFRIIRTEGLGGVRGRMITTAPGMAAALVSVGHARAELPVLAKEVARRILVADYRVPRPDVSAGEHATVGILRDLCALGYEVVFLPNDMVPSPCYEAALCSVGMQVVNRESGFEYSAHYLERHGSEFGTFYFIRVDVAETLLPIARRVAPNAKVIFHAPDLYFLRETREAELNNDPAARERALHTRDRELAMMRQSDRVVLVSPAEVPVLRGVLPDTPISVFPVLYAPVVENQRPYSERKNIFFLGGFGHSPNVNAVQWFAAEVWPHVREALPNVEFHIIGAEAPAAVTALERQPGIKVVGFVPELEPVLETLRVGVAPLQYGAGIKGKVAVTMGAGIPCVCTEIAAEGMGIKNDVHALVENDPFRFAQAIVTLYQDEKTWSRLAKNGQSLVQDKFGDAANRASLLKVLDQTQALPISLYIDYCQAADPVAMPNPGADTEVDVSIIVPVYNKWHLTRACLASVVQTSVGSGVTYEVILADDGSKDETVHAAELFPGLRVVKTPKNLGFLRNCNNAATQARGRHILLLNNDTIVLPGWLESLYGTIESDSSIAIAGSKLLYPDGLIQEAGAALLSDGSAVNVGRGFGRFSEVFNLRREVDYITGASILIRKSFWSSVGGFDERYKMAYCEDSDLAMTARSVGMRVVYEPSSEVVHFEHQSYAEQAPSHNATLQNHNIAILLDKWSYVFGKNHLPVGEWYLASSKAERSVPPATRARRSEGKLNVLYFSPFPSHPTSHGNRSTILQFGQYFQRLGHQVHFVLLQSHEYSEKDLEDMAKAWDTLDVLPFSNLMIADGGKIPFDGWYETSLGERIRLLCAKYDVDMVFCSYIFQSKMLEYVPDYILKVIDTHDKMGDRYEMLRNSGQPLEFFSCNPDEEGVYLRRADVVVARREEEARYFDSVTGRKTAIVVPHVEEPHFLERSFDGLKNVGIVASANRINLAIVRECLEAIDRKLAGNACPFTVHVAGQVKDMAEALPAWENAVFKRPWVQMHGFVPDISKFYSEMDLVVSPVTIGTGINVKTVQAMAYGMPLLTTLVGIKGVETDEPMHRHADLASLVQTLLAIQDDPQVLSRLAEVSRKRYTGFHDEAMSNIAQLFSHPKLRAGAA
ncbi:MAG: glycosyltransferase [Rhodocyclales bacterium]|nr:glycosyltransferase [Rhodocyclales bacterium]